jgi:hypothetical protein
MKLVLLGGIGAAAIVASAAATSPGSAAAAGPGPAPSSRTAARIDDGQTDDRAVAERVLSELAQRSGEDAGVVTAPLEQRIRAALSRADRLRAAGDTGHARMADALARELAEAARELQEAAATEARAAQTRREALDASTGGERERGLLEEALARAGRLRVILDASDAGAARTSPPGPEGERP